MAIKCFLCQNHKVRYRLSYCQDCRGKIKYIDDERLSKLFSLANHKRRVALQNISKLDAILLMEKFNTFEFKEKIL